MTERLFYRGDIVTKRCSYCKKERPIEEFRLRKGGRKGHTSLCFEYEHINRINSASLEKELLKKMLNDNGFKQCSKCHEIKSHSNFFKSKDMWDGFASRCKKCQWEVIVKKRGYEIPPKKPNPRKKCFTEQDYKEREHRYYLKNKEKRNKRMRLRRQTDVIFKIRCNIRRRIKRALISQSATKYFKYNEYIGCSLLFLREYLESLFTKGMTWELFLLGEIHVDHIIPLSSFDLNDPEEQRKSSHYTNLQPLWASDNHKKSNKIIKENVA